MNLKRCIKAAELAKDYIKNPCKYRLLNSSRSYSEGDHEHICYPYRLLSDKDFERVCPCHPEEPEYSDCCDECKYMGFIDFMTNQNDQKEIQFRIDESIVITWRTNENKI